MSLRGSVVKHTSCSYRGPGSVPSTRLGRKVTNICHSKLGGSEAFFWTLQAHVYYTCILHMVVHTRTQVKTNQLLMFKNSVFESQAWCRCTPITPTLGRLRWENHGFKASLDWLHTKSQRYIVKREGGRERRREVLVNLLVKVIEFLTSPFKANLINSWISFSPLRQICRLYLFETIYVPSPPFCPLADAFVCPSSSVPLRDPSLCILLFLYAPKFPYSSEFSRKNSSRM